MSQNTFKNKFGPWSLVAGAAEGIGAAYCRELAGNGMNIILVDQKKQETEELAEKLEKGQSKRPVELSEVNIRRPD